MPPTHPPAAAKERPQVSLACHNPVYREGIVRILSEDGNYVFDGPGASLDILVLDLDASLPGYRPTRGRPVLVISNTPTVPPTLRGESNQICHLPYRATPEQLREAVRRMLIGPEGLLLPASAPRIDLHGQLSPRERQVLTLISLGRTHEQVARHMDISRHTVDTYVKRARKKLQVGNKAELTRAAMSHG